MSMKRDEVSSRKVLEGYKVEPHMYYFDRRDMVSGCVAECIDLGFTERIKAVTVSYHEKGAAGFLRECVAGAVSRIAIDGGMVLFAGDLIEELAWVGIHGVAVHDSRDIKYSQRARTISIGRLRKSYECEYYQVPMPDTNG